ncbi:MAG: ArsR family transcriptional regulator, partial [Candidatus Micrarchaeota archaeon]|nr:ArsR family transcriptional regulator [Candidatus Micrarchaeota archaeon]
DAMGRTGSTKNAILGMISKKERTLSEISEELGLSPSTVSQHLHELEADGAIREIENTHMRKWKYYGLAEGAITASKGKNMPNNRTLLYYGGGVAVVAAIALLVLSMQSAAGGGLRGYLHVPISLTDPPHVPVGTTALVINYSSVEAHLSNAGNSSGWIGSNASGSINLISLLNVSQTIGNVSLPGNSMINMVRFEIKSAKIVINGTTYSVTVPSSQVTAHLDSNQAVNGSVGILLDLSPTVATIFTQNSTIFVMVPSLKAVVVPQSNTTAKVGERRSISRNESDALESAKAMINLTDASFSVSGNTTSFSVTVKNMGNQSVQIKHILVYGNESAMITTRAETSSHAQSNVSANAIGQQRMPQVDAKLDGGDAGKGSSHASVVLDTGTGNISTTSEGHGNISVNASGASVGASSESQTHASENSSENESARTESSHASANVTEEMGRGNQTSSEHEGENAMNTTVVVRTIEMLRTINFIVQSNSSTLALPFAEGEFDQNGYSLAANSSVTFTFNGTMSVGEGNIKITPIVGQPYRIVVTGEQDASASLNVTAG